MSTLNVSNITDGTDTVETSYVLNGSAKHYVHFNATGTQSIYSGAFNTSSITDNGTGNTIVTLTSAMSSTDGNVVFGSTDGNQIKMRNQVNTASSYSLQTQNSSGTAEDRNDNNGVRIGDLA
jgi:hypothetical protein